jgi:uncharacterized membrane protein YuzA (DUF378 family)
MRYVRFAALVLMVIGALNWGLIGFFQYNLIAAVFGGMKAMLPRVIFALVGLAGLYGVGLICRCCCGHCKCGPGCKCDSHHKK